MTAPIPCRTVLGRLARWFALAAILILPPALALAQAPPAGPPPAGPPALSAADLERLAALLRDDAARAAFLRNLEALAATERANARPGAAGTAPAATPAGAAGAQPAAAPLLASDTLGAALLLGLSQRIEHAAEAMLSGLRTVADLPGLLRGLTELAADPVAQARLADAAWKLLAMLGGGLLAEFAAARALAPARRRLDRLAPHDREEWRWLKRLPLVLGRLVLELVPVTAFALAAPALLGLLHPLPSTQLAGVLVAHVYVGARLAFAVARMLLSPASDHLRLVPCSDAVAEYCTRWLRRLLLLGLGGYALAELGVFFGISWAAYDAVLRLTLLAITGCLIRIILQSRGFVAGLLRAKPLDEDEVPDRGRRLLRGLRDWLAESWHVGAVLWLVAGWLIWALAIDHGFTRLLRISATTFLVVTAAKLLDEGARRLLDRLAQPDPEALQRFPGLPVRARRYAPALHATITVVVGCLGLLVLLECWGIDSFGWFARGTLGDRVLDLVLSVGSTLVLAFVVWEAANGAILRHLARLSREQQAARGARVRTLLPMLRTALAVVIVVVVLLNALQELGVNVAPLLAGAGVVGLAVGFGSQKLVQDVITGVFLLFEDAVAVGDVVTLAGLTGVVEQLSIRAIRLRATDGSVHVVPFSAVTTVTNMTRDFAFAVLDLTVDYREDTDRIADVLREISAEIRADPKFKALVREDIDVWGVDKLVDVGVVVRARVKTEPTARMPVTREFNRRIRQRFDELVLRIPTPIAPPPEAEAEAAE